MTKREGAILTAYTGIRLCSSLSDFYKYAEELLGSPILKHQYRNPDLWSQIKKASEADFRRIIKEMEP